MRRGGGGSGDGAGIREGPMGSPGAVDPVVISRVVTRYPEKIGWFLLQRCHDKVLFHIEQWDCPDGKTKDYTIDAVAGTNKIRSHVTASHKSSDRPKCFCFVES